MKENDHTEDVIKDALLTKIQVQTQRITDLEAEVQRRKARQSDLRIALSNLISDRRDDPQYDRIKALLDISDQF